MRTRADARPDSSLIDWATRSASVMSRSDWSGFQAASVFAMSVSAAALDAWSLIGRAASSASAMSRSARPGSEAASVFAMLVSAVALDAWSGSGR